MNLNNLLRKEIIFTPLNEGVVSYNYHYLVTQESYRALSIEDSNFGKFLHDDGFRMNKKKYKLFLHQIYLENYENNSEGFKISKDTMLKLTISGQADIVNKIVKGFKTKNNLVLNGVVFQINNIKNDKRINFNKINVYRVRTPIVESIYDKETNKIKYLDVKDYRYYQALGKNLLNKYHLVYGEEYTGDLFFEIKDYFTVKQKSTFVKEMYIFGYYNFELFIEAEPKMQKVAYYLGLGQNNSLGMGLLSYIKSLKEGEVFE